MPNILEMKGRIESFSKIIEDIKAEPKASFRCEKHNKNQKPPKLILSAIQGLSALNKDIPIHTVIPSPDGT